MSGLDLSKEIEDISKDENQQEQNPLAQEFTSSPALQYLLDLVYRLDTVLSRVATDVELLHKSVLMHEALVQYLSSKDNEFADFYIKNGLSNIKKVFPDLEKENTESEAAHVPKE